MPRGRITRLRPLRLRRRYRSWIPRRASRRAPDHATGPTNHGSRPKLHGPTTTLTPSAGDDALGLQGEAGDSRSVPGCSAHRLGLRGQRGGRGRTLLGFIVRLHRLHRVPVHGGDRGPEPERMRRSERYPNGTVSKASGFVQTDDGPRSYVILGELAPGVPVVDDRAARWARWHSAVSTNCSRIRQSRRHPTRARPLLQVGRTMADTCATDRAEAPS